MNGSHLTVEKLVLLSTKLHNLNIQSQNKMGVSLVQWMTLKAIIEHPGASAGDIAERTFVHPSTLTQVIKRLERENLIVVTSHPLDSRKLLILISAHGRKTFDEGKVALESLLAGQGQSFMLDECIHFVDSLVSKIDENSEGS